MKETRDAISSKFDEAEANYLTTIDDEANTIQTTYQQTLKKEGMQSFAFPLFL